MTFKVDVDAVRSRPASTPVENVGGLDTAEEPPENSDTTTVNVVTDPNSSMDKSVRNFTTNPTGSFTDTVNGAKPGQTIEYQLEYTNAGPGTATNVVVTDTVAAKSTYVAGSCTLTRRADAAVYVQWFDDHVEPRDGAGSDDADDDVQGRR